MLELDRDGVTALVHRAVARAARRRLFPVPVIFGITGHCPAGGTVLAITATIACMALGDFGLGLNEVQVGLFPGGPSTVRSVAWWVATPRNC